jgi:VanZ family protein
MKSPASIVVGARILLVVIFATAAMLLFGPFQGAERLFGLDDKQAHTFASFGLTALSMLAFPRSRRNDLFLAAMVLAIASEFIQSLVGRDGDIGDALADAAGVLMAVAPTYIEGVRKFARGGFVPSRRRGDRWARARKAARLAPSARIPSSDLV